MKAKKLSNQIKTMPMALMKRKKLIKPCKLNEVAQTNNVYYRLSLFINL